MRTVGVIGLGSIGTRHARNLKAMGHFISTYDPGRGHKENRLQQLLKESDVFVVASPTSTHYEYIKKCEGKPTFVEKPIHDEVMAGIRDSIDFNSVVMVGYNLRFHSCVLKAKEWLDAGLVGTPIWSNLVCAQKNNKYKDHVILNWSHEIDLALHLLGACDVTACVGDLGIADVSLTHLISGCRSTIHLDYHTQPEVRQTIIVGDKGTIILDLANRYAWLRDLSSNVIDQFQGRDSFDENYVDEMETFLARVDGKETVGCTAAEALVVLHTCLRARRLSELKAAA